MIDKIWFSHYKAFNDITEIDVKPITLIIGKNSSGKSSILKLFPLLSRLISITCNQPMYLCMDDISLGARYEDLFHNGTTSDLMLGVGINGIEISAKYYINGGKIAIETHSTKKGDKEILLDLASDKQHVSGLINHNALREINESWLSLRQQVNYVGPFRIRAPHNIIFKGFDDIKTVGYNGSSAYDILLNSYLSNKTIMNQVSSWMAENLEGQAMRFTNISNNGGIYSLEMVRGNYSVNVSSVGQGLAQVLPIIVQSYIASPESINVFEQPALHLHPAAHSKVAERLGISAKERGCKYVIESHSENMLLGFRRLVADKSNDFTPDDIAIYFVDMDENGAYLDKITLNENGDLSSWPKGVFSESFELLREINQMRR